MNDFITAKRSQGGREVDKDFLHVGPGGRFLKEHILVSVENFHARTSVALTTQEQKRKKQNKIGCRQANKYFDCFPLSDWAASLQT